jgi:hypothetical protein
MAYGVNGVSKGDVAEHVVAALRGYAEISDGPIQFDLVAAAKIEPMASKPGTAARSKSIVTMGDFATELFVLVFRPEDGTGDESAHNLAEINTDQYPRSVNAVPRDKGAAQGEAHLSLVTFRDDGTAVPFAGLLDLVGFEPGYETGVVPKTLVRVGSLGQTPAEFRASMLGSEQPEARATATVRRYGALAHAFGDPHAVYNRTSALQVAAFVAVPKDQATELLRVLDARLPRDY